jgi:hypothetical protein
MLMLLTKAETWRLVLGFLFAPFVPAVVFSIMQWGGLGGILPVLIYGAYPAAIVLGIPAYFLLRHWVGPRLVTIMLVGGVIAALPWLMLFLLPQSGSVRSEINDCVTRIDGYVTWCGMVDAFKLAAEIFSYGALGGLVFWLCVVWRAPQPTIPSRATN